MNTSDPHSQIHPRIACRIMSPIPLLLHEDHPHHQPSATRTITPPPLRHGSTSPELPENAKDVEKLESEEAIAPDKVSAFKGLGWLDRFLALWILLAMAIGIILGNFVPNAGPALQTGKFVGVSVPIGAYRVAAWVIGDIILIKIAIGLLVMMYPILCKVKYETLHLVFQKREIWIQIAFSIVMNWLVAPFVMVALLPARSFRPSILTSSSSASRGLSCLTKRDCEKA